MQNAPVLAALGAAALFGASTPLAKALIGDVPPLLLAGIVYLGSGVGLALARLARDRGWKNPNMPRNEWPWLGGAVFFGGILGPALLMFGLARTSASTASLLLNLEAVLSALIAWVVFHENADRRIVLGMVAIVAGGVVLSWQGAASLESWIGPGLIASACLCWAIDNNLTRKVSGHDALFIATTKGTVAGMVNVSLALLAGALIPPLSAVGAAMVIGLLGYGTSLVLFVHALRGLGTARTGAYFSTAPFIGAAVAILVLGESASPGFWTASFLMGIGVWLHITESHAHLHDHEPVQHDHSHVHDAHHRHDHGDGTGGEEPHAHPHSHAWVRHAHPHYPDVHHQHRHRS